MLPACCRPVWNPHPVEPPQEAEDGDASGSGMAWEAGKGLTNRSLELALTEAVVGAGPEEAGVGALSSEHPAQALSHSTAGLRVLTENGPTQERRLRVSWGVHCTLAPSGNGTAKGGGRLGRGLVRRPCGAGPTVVGRQPEFTSGGADWWASGSGHRPCRTDIGSWPA